jgi:hypothetical protein
MANTPTSPPITPLKELELINELFDKILPILQNDRTQETTLQDVLVALPHVILMIEHDYKTIAGSTKKKLALMAIRQVIMHTIHNENTRNEVLLTYDLIAPSMIDAVVYVANSQEFKKMKKKCVSFFCSCNCHSKEKSSK